jgi:hypothetical protein
MFTKACVSVTLFTFSPDPVVTSGNCVRSTLMSVVLLVLLLLLPKAAAVAIVSHTAGNLSSATGLGFKQLKRNGKSSIKNLTTGHFCSTHTPICRMHIQILNGNLPIFYTVKLRPYAGIGRQNED